MLLITDEGKDSQYINISDKVTTDDGGINESVPHTSDVWWSRYDKDRLWL